MLLTTGKNGSQRFNALFTISIFLVVRVLNLAKTTGTACGAVGRAL
jgi:hypothetical protein